MFTVDVSSFREVDAIFKQAGDQLPFALSKAINDLAFMVRNQEMETVSRVFDRPKPQTVKNFKITKAKKTKMYADIWFDQMFEKGYDEYMLAQVEGGQRRMKPSEKRLKRFFVPGMGAKMDRYGNMQGGQTTQILSRLGKFGDVAGYDMNETSRSRKRRYGVSKGTEYFVISKQKGGLKPGVYMRTQKRGGFTSIGAPRAVRGQTGSFQSGAAGMIRGRGVVPVMVFTPKAPTYKARFPFFDVAQEVVERNYKQVLSNAVDYALRTAR